MGSQGRSRSQVNPELVCIIFVLHRGKGGCMGAGMGAWGGLDACGKGLGWVHGGGAGVSAWGGGGGGGGAGVGAWWEGLGWVHGGRGWGGYMGEGWGECMGEVLG